MTIRSTFESRTEGWEVVKILVFLVLCCESEERSGKVVWEGYGYRCIYSISCPCCSASFSRSLNPKHTHKSLEHSRFALVMTSVSCCLPLCCFVHHSLHKTQLNKDTHNHHMMMIIIVFNPESPSPPLPLPVLTYTTHSKRQARSMFGNLFGKQSIDNLDLEGWRRKRQREGK